MVRVRQDQRRLLPAGLTAGERERFARQIRFAPLGEAGQERLRAGSVLIVGVGALGTHTAELLVRAGVGRVVLVDRDVVELGNLPRQGLFDAEDARAGTPKAVAAAAHLAAIDPDVRIEPVVGHFDAELFGALPAADVLVDGTDNYATRFLLNDLAVRERRSWVYGGVVAAEGRAMAVVPGVTPCLRCLLPEGATTAAEETCETAGVLSPAAVHVAAFQVAETLKLLSGHAATRGMLVVDVWRGAHSIVLRDLAPRDDCRSCGTLELPALSDDAAARTVGLCGRDAVQILPPRGVACDLERLATALAGRATDVARTAHLLRFAAEGCRFSVFPDGRALLFGISDEGRARALYDRFVGG